MLRVCFISMKGGTGKTTLSVLFSYYMANRGKRVLFMDMDPQGNATVAMAESRVFDDEGRLKKGMPHIIEGFLTPGLSSEQLKAMVRENVEVLEPVKGRQIHLIPNFLEAHRYDLHLVSNHAVPIFVRDVVGAFEDTFDLVVMDCPPYLSALSYSALYGANAIVIPAEASKFGLVGVELLLKVVEDVVRRRGEGYSQVVIQPNRVKNTKACTFYLEAMGEKYGRFVSEVPVKETVEVPRMVRDGMLAFNTSGSSYRLGVVKAMEELARRLTGE